MSLADDILSALRDSPLGPAVDALAFHDRARVAEVITEVAAEPSIGRLEQRLSEADDNAAYYRERADDLSDRLDTLRRAGKRAKVCPKCCAALIAARIAQAGAVCQACGVSQ